VSQHAHCCIVGTVCALASAGRLASCCCGSLTTACGLSSSLDNAAAQAVTAFCASVIGAPSGMAMLWNESVPCSTQSGMSGCNAGCSFRMFRFFIASTGLHMTAQVSTAMHQRVRFHFSMHQCALLIYADGCVMSRSWLSLRPRERRCAQLLFMAVEKGMVEQQSLQLPTHVKYLVSIDIVCC
jgi:hypothetical protein